MTVETFTISATTGKASITKDPEAVLDYSFDWTDWLAAASTPADTIASATCTVTGSTTSAVDATLHDDNVVTAWVSGGAAGDTIALKCNIVTTGLREDERTVYLKVKER